MTKKVLGPTILASAVIWAIMIIACALILKGTEYKDEVTLTLSGGMTIHLLFLWIPLIRQMSKLNKQ